MIVHLQLSSWELQPHAIFHTMIKVSQSLSRSTHWHMVLGAALIQDQGPIAFTSKALTETESRYSNIEREMLGIVYRLERFHYYAYGRPVIVETDHWPLVSIVQRNLHNAPQKLARILLRVQRYNVQLHYVPGKDIPLADALSRISARRGRNARYERRC